jgi:ribosomal protein RSM22 (predicted rRNA methylase)
MALPEDLTNALEKQFSKFPRSVLTAAAADLTSRYRSPVRDQLQTFITSDQHRLAYLAARMPATYAVVDRVLQECRSRMPGFSPRSVCDIGAGPGTATWAALNVFPGIADATLYEKDSGWLKLGKVLMEQSVQPVLRDAVWKETDLAADYTLGKYDLVVLSYVVGELSPEALKVAVAKAWGAASQVLVVIEPGTPHGFERIRTVREQLIEAGGFLVAPCPHQDKCPMAGGDWCHFAKRLERSSLHMAVKDVSVGYEDEKYSYVVASKTPVVLPEARILRHPQHHSGHTEFVLCTKAGLEKRTISRRHKDLYKRAKKLDWGDVLE